METRLGQVVLFGSGETSSHAQPVYARVMQELGQPVRVSILETPAGFQLNSANVAEEIGEYLRVHLQNYHPEIHIIPARKKGGFFSPDNPEILEPMYTSNMIFFGPGSPTYAVRQLAGSLAWEIVRARHRLGATVVAASAATIAMSAYALPVYEIYKVGEEVHWKPGLDFCADYGLSAVFVPHWNNNEGGEGHDTSRCFMGKPRFAQLLDLLPQETIVVGVDELTALYLDPQRNLCTVMGLGGVTLLEVSTRRESRFESG
ncbi:MAG: cysteinyl-tRNA synthetase, partial [Chloroflexi bacterium]|nr:cysteinyl-tRNA synthetase [Chloroflexota bacterium]